MKRQRSLSLGSSPIAKRRKVDLNSVISKVIKDILEPDYTKLRKEIEKTLFVKMKLNLGTFNPESGEEFVTPVWGKVMYTCKECAIVQELELTWNASRFKTYKIMFGNEWDTKFVSFINEDHPDYIHLGLRTWEDGYHMYMD
tara:strand:+ start:59 stop:484 length:426 start_codon:yes stop_codon:yes gene_type:complete